MQLPKVNVHKQEASLKLELMKTIEKFEKENDYKFESHEINNILLDMINRNDKPKLTERISAGLDRELERQKKAGKEFISDEEIDTLIDGIIKEELGDGWKENYT